MASTVYGVYRIHESAHDDEIPEGALTFVRNVEARTPHAAVEAAAKDTGSHMAIPTRYLKRIEATVTTETVVKVTTAS